MKGTNMLKLNQATLVSALQDYLDSEMPGHVVKSINLPGDGYFGSHAGAIVDELVVVVEGQTPVVPAKTAWPADTAGRSE